MIKDVMVRLDGTAGDDLRIGTAESIVRLFDGRLIGLYVNVLPSWIAPAETDPAAAYAATAELLQAAHEAANYIEDRLLNRLDDLRLKQKAELRRFDVFSHDEADVTAREARSADVFVALRPNGKAAGVLHEPEHLVEGVLFGSGRHLCLVPPESQPNPDFHRIMIAWNGSRESARAMAESMPYLHNASKVSVVIVDDKRSPTILGDRAVNHLKHHGIEAQLHATTRGNADVGEKLLSEIRRTRSDVVVMGGFGHSRLREWIFGSTTSEVLHQSPVPVLVAH